MTDMKNNDERILKLQKLAEEKKQAISENSKPVKYLTSKILVLDGITYNLSVINSLEEITLLMSRIGALATGYAMFTANSDLDDEKYYDNLKISGFHVDDWAEDIKTRLQQLEVKEDKILLAKIEKKLTELLSEEKKKELELDELEKFLLN